MNIHDLGRLDDSVILFGGPYSNLAATEAMLAMAQGRQMICTGDVVAYCADPAATVAALRASECIVVAGNCERQLAAGAMDCGCGFDVGSTCDRLSAGWFAHASREIGADDRAWMAGLPDMVRFIHAGRRYGVIHGGLSDISRFIWPMSPDAEFVEEIRAIEAVSGRVDVVIGGHCGIAFCRQIGAVAWLNSGAIGMPPNDGSAGTRYMVLRDGQAEIETLNYDHTAARHRMQQVGLTQGYDTALTTGWWPSEEVLPAQLRRGARASG